MRQVNKSKQVFDYIWTRTVVLAMLLAYIFIAYFLLLLVFSIPHAVHQIIGG